jgi:hypothetical protein
MITKLMAKFNLANLNYLFNWVAFINFYYLSYTRFSSLIHKYYFTFVAGPTCQEINSDPLDTNQICGILENKKEIIEHLGSYLAGLIEGDGYISITNQNRVILGITFNIKDKPLAEKLLNYLGKGFIATRKTNSIELRFSEKKTIIRIITLINGKFRTPKIEQLYKLIDWVNNKYSMDISKLPLDKSPLSQNSWLTGFIDADGGFYIRYSLKQILCKFALEQRMIYPKTGESYYTVLNEICLFLNVKLSIRDRLNYKNSYYIIRVENQNSTKILIDYLNKYPLLSSKYLDFLEWAKSFKIISNKAHMTVQGKHIILAAKNNMNDKRTNFNWEHLNFLECRVP